MRETPFRSTGLKTAGDTRPTTYELPAWLVTCGLKTATTSESSSWRVRSKFGYLNYQIQFVVRTSFPSSSPLLLSRALGLFHSAADETMESPTLTQFNAEIAGIDSDIRLERAKLATATSEEKVVIERTIEEWKETLKGLRATRDYLLRNPVPAPAPCKNSPSRPRR